MTELSQTRLLMTKAAGTPLRGWEELGIHVQTKSFERGQQIFAAGERQPYIYVIRTGIVKLCYLNENGGEWIKSFIGEGGYFACPNAVLNGGETDYFAVAADNTVLEQTPYAALQRLAECDPDWQKAIRSLLEAHILRKDQRERELLTMTPEERYISFMQTQEELASRIQMKDIAKYLGVTPEALSRIRRRLIDKLI